MAQNNIKPPSSSLAVPPPTDTKSPVSLRPSWERQCLKLSAEERQIFASHACNGLQDYLRTIEAACQLSKDQSYGHKILEWFELIFKVVELYLPALNIGIQAYPNPGSLVLGGITAIIQTFSRLTSYLKLTVKTLSTMGKKVSILDRYDKDIYSDEPELQNYLVVVYGDILGFCRKAFRFKRKHGETLAKIKGVGLVLFTSFESHFDQELRSFYSNMEQVESLALLCDKKRLEKLCKGHEAHQRDFAQMAQETRDYFQSQSSRDQMLIDLAKREQEYRQQTARSKREKFKAESLDWLSGMNFGKAYAQRCQEHLPGTGQWLLDSEVYCDWKTNEGSDLLWVKGKPGCGKSVLAACAIHNLRLEIDSETACGYVFCRRDDESFEYPANIMASLARQISEQKDDMNPVLESSFARSKRGVSLTLKTISSIMKAAISRFSKTYLVLDALDECKDNHYIAREIVDLMQEQPGSALKIMVLSRPDYALEQSFDSYKLLQPDLGLNETDVQTYVKSLFNKKSQANTSRKVIDECISKAYGTFLWIKLLKEEFRMTPMTLKQQLECLKDTPSGLVEIYRRMIEGLDAQKPSVRMTACHVLLWVTHARRNLTKDEMLNAVAEYDGVTTVHEASDSRYRKAEHLVIICKHLVSIDKDGCFRLCHESARDVVLDYLGKAGYEDTQRTVDDDVSSQYVSSYLAETCLTYLLLKTFERGPARSVEKLRILQKKYPLLEYAARFWSTHLPLETSPRLQTLILEFVRSPPRRELSMQIVLHGSEVVKKFWNFPNSSNALHIVSLLGLKVTAESLSDALALTQKADGSGTTPLIYALIGRHHSMALWLIERMRTPEGFSLDTEQKKLALHEAVVLGWLDILQALISTEDSLVNSVVDEGGSLLAKASLMANFEAAKFLIDCKADVELKDGSGNSPLILAVLSRQTSIVKLLLQNAADPECPDTDGCTPLHNAATVDNADAAEAALLAGANPDAQAPLQDNQTPLHFAAAVQSLAVIRVLHREHPNLGVTSSKKHTALHIAAFFRRSKSAGLLLSLGCPKNEVDRERRTALFVAAGKGSLDTIKVLVEAGCKTRQADINGRTEIHAAARSGKASIAEYLLAREPVETRLEFTNRPNERGETPLHEATDVGSARMVNFILKSGANVDALSGSGSSPLHYAARQGYKAMLGPLLERTENANPRDEWGNTPLHLAAGYGSIEFVRNFFREYSKAGLLVDLDAQNIENETALTTALRFGFEEVAEFLLEKGSALTRNSGGDHAIHHAGWHGFESISKKLLKHDDVCSKGYSGRTPLLCAATRGHLHCVKLLANHQPIATLNTADDAGTTPVHAALKGRHSKVVDYLLDLKADHETPDEHGNSMIHTAARLGCLSIVRRLLNLGCNISTANHYGETPCYFAVCAENIEIVGALLTHSNDAIDKPNFLGYTCAHSAAHRGNLPMLRKLVEHGADCGARDDLGVTVALLAARCGHWEILEYLKDRQVPMDVADFEGTTPLLEATRGGFPNAVQCLLKIDSGGINKYNSGGESALILATGLGCLKTTRILLAHGADPYHRDSNGMNALDYARRHRHLSRVFADLQWSPRPHEADTRLSRTVTRITLHATIRECCDSLLNLPADFSKATNFYRRQTRLTTLSNALLREKDYNNAKPCFMELFWPPKSISVRQGYVCDICGHANYESDVYVCKSCPTWTARGRLDLCEKCHDSYTAAGYGAPEALIEIEELERKVQAVRAQLPDELSLLSVIDIIDYFRHRCDWVPVMLNAYQDWEQTFNSVDTFKWLARPGQQYINMIEEIRAIMNKVNSGDEMVSQDMVQLEWATATYEKFKREYRADKELSSFLCSNHDFCVVPFDKYQKLKDAGVELDSESGQVTKRFLERLLVTYAQRTDLPTEPNHEQMTKNACIDLIPEGKGNQSGTAQVSRRPMRRRPVPQVNLTPLSQHNLTKVWESQPARTTQARPISLFADAAVRSHTIQVEIKSSRIIAAVQARLRNNIQDAGPDSGVSGKPPSVVKRTISFAIIPEPDISLHDGVRFSETQSDLRQGHLSSTSLQSEAGLIPGDLKQGRSGIEFEAHSNALATAASRREQRCDSKTMMKQSEDEIRHQVAYIKVDEGNEEDMNIWIQALNVTETMQPGFIESYLEGERLAQQSIYASDQDDSGSESDDSERNESNTNDNSDEEGSNESDEENDSWNSSN